MIQKMIMGHLPGIHPVEPINLFIVFMLFGVIYIPPCLRLFNQTVYAVWEANGATEFDIYENGEYVETITENRYRRHGDGIQLTIVAKWNSNTMSHISAPIDISID